MESLSTIRGLLNKRNILIFLASLLLLALLLFTAYVFISISPTSNTPLAPEAAKAPFRVYGVIEPEGREVYLSSPGTKRVAAILVSPGEEVKKGQPLIKLDTAVEKEKADLALARLKAQEVQLKILQDKWERNKTLFKDNIISEEEFSQLTLNLELEEKRTLVAQKEYAVAQADLDQYAMESPIEGKVYKINAHIGQALAPDTIAIILGANQLNVRLSIESFWTGRFDTKSEYGIYNAETDQLLGTGEFSYYTPFMGPRALRTEDPSMSLDTQYQDAYLKLKTDSAPPLRLLVYARQQDEKRP